jgi:hypothetical protein
MLKNNISKNENRERQLAQACILRSREVIIAKAALFTNREQQFYVNRMPPFLPSQNALKELEKEIINRIDEYERNIYLYMKEICMLNRIFLKIGKISDKNETEYLPKMSFSSKELKEGYVFFHKNTRSAWVEGVLILGVVDIESNTEIHFEIGKIYDFKEIKDYLFCIKPAIKWDITLSHALRKLKANENK